MRKKRQDDFEQVAVRRKLDRAERVLSDPPSATFDSKMRLLVDVVQALSLARELSQIVDIVRRAARQLTGADGATFVLRDGDYCYYADEDAISPLWKGQRFPLDTCISGWAMLNRKSTIIPDIYEDLRIPHAAYRPTFVRSLAMVPIRTAAPIGAIGNYWAHHHECTPEELMLLESLANTTAVAIENVNLYLDLENQVRERTRELQAANDELEAFTSAVSHDLRAPLRAINAELELRALPTGELPQQSTQKVRQATSRMASLIDDLLRLSKINRMELAFKPINLGELAEGILQRLRAAEPDRNVSVKIDVSEVVEADEGLICVALENLFSNALKYSSKRAESRIEFTCTKGDDGRCVYRIADNGAGFDPKFASQLFKPFARLHDDNVFAGTGVGLATVERVIRRHNGRIWANSDGASGAEFMFTLHG